MLGRYAGNDRPLRIGSANHINFLLPAVKGQITEQFNVDNTPFISSRLYYLKPRIWKTDTEKLGFQSNNFNLE